MQNINSEEEYKQAEARLEALAGATPGSAEAQELKAITIAIVEYLKKTKSKLNNK